MVKQKTLSQCKCFWAIWVIGLLLALLTALLINYSMAESASYKSCESFFLPHCLQNFISNMKIPLGIATVTMTIAGFWALLFRSNQTAKQIEVTLENNIYTNYISHKKEFESLLESFGKVHDVHFEPVNEIYSKLFPDNNKISFNPIGDSSYISVLINKHNNLVIEWKEIIDLVSYLSKVDRQRTGVSNPLFVELFPEKYSYTNVKYIYGKEEDKLKQLKTKLPILASHYSENLLSLNCVIESSNTCSTENKVYTIRVSYPLVILLSNYAELPKYSGKVKSPQTDVPSEVYDLLVISIKKLILVK